MFLALLCLAAYVIGASPFGLLAGKVVRGKDFDIRQHGSGNIGATNVFRILGKPTGIVVFTLDILKGLLPALFAVSIADGGSWTFGGLGGDEVGRSIPGWGPILVGLAAILGHNYTFWLGFKGGKGIATSGGVLIGLLPIAAAFGLLAWIGVAITTRYVALASIAAAVAIPITVAVQGAMSGDWDIPRLAFAIFLCIMAIWKHRSNIARLRAGTENRIGDKKDA